MIEIGEEGFNEAVGLFKAIYIDSPIGIEIYDSKGKLIDLNQSCMELFGVSNKDEVKGFDLFNDPNIPKDHLTKLRQRETVRYESSFDFDLVNKNKSYRTIKSGKIHLDVLITPLFIGENKSISNYLVQIQDNSEQKIAEHKLIDLNKDLEKKVHERTKQVRKSEEDWQILVEEAPDIIFTVDRNGRILYINKVPKGITKEEAIGTDVLDYIDPIYHETVKTSVEKVFLTGESDSYEISARGPDDGFSWYSTRFGAIKQDEEVVSVMLITRDITERKRMEIKLKESEEKFRTISDQSLVGIVITQDGIGKYANKQMEALSGYSIEEMKNWKAGEFLKIIHPEYRKFVAEQSRKKQMGLSDVIDQYQYMGIKKSGENIWVDDYSKTITYEGTPAVLSILIDITEKKEAEQKLKESEEIYRTLIDNILDIIFEMDLDGNITYLSPQTIDILGYKLEEMYERNAFSFIHPDDQEEVLKNQNYVVNTGEVGSVEFRIQHKEGHYVTVSSRGQLIEKDNKKKIVGLFRDITERKEAEQELESSEVKYRNFIENFQGIAFQGYQDFTVAFFHGEVENITGYNEDDFVLGRKKWNQIIHPDDIKEINEKVKKFHERIDETDKREYRIICKNGKIRWVTEYNKKFYDKVKNKAGVRGIIIDITERKRIEEKVHQEREKAEMYLNLVNVIIVALDRHGNISMINQKGIDILGWNEGELVGKSWFENCLLPEDRDRVHDYFKKLMKGELDVIPFYENPIITKYGEEKLIAWSTILSRDSNGKITSLLSSGEDITDRKKAEEKIQYQAMLVDEVSDAIISTDLDFNIITWNKAAESIYDWKAEEVIGKNIRDIIPVEYPYEEEEIVLEQFLKQGFWKGEVIQTSKEENSMNILSSVSTIKDITEKPIGVVAVNRNITEQIKAEEKIRESEKKLIDLIEAVPIGISISTPEGKAVECNSNAYQIFGYNSKREFLKTPVVDLYHIPSDRERFVELHERGLVKDFEAQFKHKDGTVFWGSLTSIAQKVGHQITFINSFQDITDRKLADIKIQQSEAELTAIYNYTPIAIILVDNERRIRKINKYALKFTDRQEEEVFGIHGGEALRCLYSIKDPRGCGFSEDCQDCVIRNTVLNTFETKIPHINVETTLYLLPGRGIDKVHLLVSTVPLIFEGEDLVLISFIDITDRMDAEQKLRESEEKFRTLFNFAGDSICIHDLEGHFLEVNQTMANKLGYTKEELLKMTPMDIDTPEYSQVVMERIGKLIEDGSSFFETAEVTKEGKVIPIELSSTIIEYKSNTAVLSIARDISERKASIQKLRESEERFKYLVSSSPAIIYTSKPSGDFGATFISDNVQKKWGYSSEDFTNDSDFWLNHIHPDDKEHVLTELSDLFVKEHIIHDYRFKLNDGTYLWMRDEVELVKDKEGNPFGIIGSVIDINDRKIVEQKLKESEKRYKHLANELEMILDHIPGIVVYKDTENNILRVNKFMADAHNLKKEDMEGKSSFKFYPKEEAQAYWEDDLEVIESKKPKLNIIEPWETLEGRRWVNTSKIPYIDEDGNVNGILAIAFDVTDRVKAEQRLKESEERYRELFENSPIALFEEDYSDLKKYVDNLKASGIVDFEEYFDENPEEILNCGSMINIIDVNKKVLEIYKANSMEEFVRRKTQIEKSLYRKIPPDLLLVNKQELLSLINGDTTFESEAVTKTLTGDVIYLYMKTLIIPGFEKTWSKVIVSLLNITNRKITEQKLKESEEKFRTIAEQSSIGVVIQQGGFIKFANNAVSEIIEYPMEEIANQAIGNLYKMVYEEDLPLMIEKFNGRQTGDYESVSQFDLRILSKLGKIKWVSIFTKPIIYLGKKAVLSTLIDITAKKQIEEELTEVSRLKSDLLSRTSHELKTPLVSIKGYADLLLSQHYDELDFYTISILHEMKQGCSRLESLIKDLLETSKLESGEIELNKSEDDLAFLIRFCIRDLQGLIETRKHELILEIQDNLITLFEKEKIYEVIINLLSNSIKYTPSNGTIKINSEIRDNHYMISVKDNGIGLTEEEISKIFKKFGKIERYGKGLDVVSEGSGLGLYISKKIIELHGGNIWVESEGRDKGSTFYFSLPIIKD